MVKDQVHRVPSACCESSSSLLPTWLIYPIVLYCRRFISVRRMRENHPVPSLSGISVSKFVCLCFTTGPGCINWILLDSETTPIPRNTGARVVCTRRYTRHAHTNLGRGKFISWIKERERIKNLSLLREKEMKRTNASKKFPKISETKGRETERGSI